jgi:hypothetical protein
MKLRELAEKIDKSKENEAYVDLTDFDGEFGMSFDYMDQDRLKSYWAGNWYCTDSYVGYRMYYLDGEAVAFSTQYGRKSNENLYWFSEEAAIKVREYLVSLILKNEETLNIELADFDKELGDGFTIEFNSQILNDEGATLNGDPVKIICRIKDTPDYGIDRKLMVELQNGQKQEVLITDLVFSYHLQKNRA